MNTLNKIKGRFNIKSRQEVRDGFKVYACIMALGQFDS